MEVKVYSSNNNKVNTLQIMMICIILILLVIIAFIIYTQLKCNILKESTNESDDTYKIAHASAPVQQCIEISNNEVEII